MGPSGYPLGTAESDRAYQPGQELGAEDSGWSGAACPACLALLCSGEGGSACGPT